MTDVATLQCGLEQLTTVVASLEPRQMDTVTNCEPWTVRQLASHALNNQLLWAGMVTGQQLVSVEDTMTVVAYTGDLATYAEEVAAHSATLWSTDGVLESLHTTPFGLLPGAIVINFPTVDAFAHAWDLSASVGAPIEFAPDVVPTVTEIVAATCTDGARAAGVIKPVTEAPTDATTTERLMAAAGRNILREA